MRATLCVLRRTAPSAVLLPRPHLLPAAWRPLGPRPMARAQRAGVKGVGVIVCMYLSRFFIYSSFNILWAMTPEYYPTSVRNFGLGVNNAFSRIAGLVSPFAVKVSPGAWPHGPEAIFAAFSLVAAGLVFLLPPDKKGQSLDDTLADVKDVPELQRRLSSSAGGGRRGSGGVGGGVKDVGVGAELDEEAVSAPEQVLLSPR